MTNSDLVKMGVNQKSYPQNIYKYRSDSDKTERIITDNELWFSDPLLFNDPYDCHTPINTTTPMPDIKAWLASVGFLPEYIDQIAELLKQNPNLMKESSEKALSNLGVCCFSTIGDSILQWSHYSDYHRGICLKFDLLADPDFFTTPIIVTYRKVMQHYNHYIQSNKIIEYLVSPKFDQWSYESEIRIVKNQENSSNKVFKFADNALAEIIFGAKTPDTVIDKYRRLCATSGKGHVQFSKMELGTGAHYELVKMPV